MVAHEHRIRAINALVFDIVNLDAVATVIVGEQVVLLASFFRINRRTEANLVIVEVIQLRARAM